MTPDRLSPILSAIAGRAAPLDAAAAFPAADMAALAAAGFAVAPLPASLGGIGLGTRPGDGVDICTVLRRLGAANPAVGRLFEAHVNAVRLVLRFGQPEDVSALAEDCRASRFFGLWVTDAPGRPLRLEDGILHGSKGPCSGAGHLARALATVSDGGATRLAVLHLDGTEAVVPIGTALLGMRAATNGTVRLDGSAPARLLGQDGDYLREPDFSTGAWRTMAVTLGILDSLVDAVRQQLRSRGHAGAPLQQARFGELLIARGTAAHWTLDAARVAEAATDPVPDQVAAVNLARIAAEHAALDAMGLVQRALGLPALLQPNPVERHLRDLATILRQPAPDAVLTEAAQHALAVPGPATP